ncbi:ankryin [Methylomonas methanica]|uniref:Ankryin n=1 Tax=Methylomonas methanica TaxID=421 RepID=A0A177MJY8_METMH|nr:ankryin [Methylomonas methanica]
MVALTVAASCLFQSEVAFAIDAISARKELQQMGVEYTESQFATSAGAGDMLAVKLFLDAGMDVNAGASAALGLAAGRGQLEMVKLLLANGAKPTANALQFARTRGRKEIEDILVQAGAKE